jgi:hypothetical protein
MAAIIKQIQKNAFFSSRSRHVRIKLESWM